jgi:hypothetical protein
VPLSLLVAGTNELADATIRDVRELLGATYC